MERKINAPDQEYLTDVEASKWLAIELEDFREYVRLGLIPQGMKYKKRVDGHRWPWMDLVAVAHLISRRHLKLPGDEE